MNHNTILIFNLHPKFTWKVQKKRVGTERGITSRERSGLSPSCLFILLFLQDLWDLSKVRGVMEECVSLEHEIIIKKKKITTSDSTGSTGSRFIWTLSLCPNKHVTKIGAFSPMKWVRCDVQSDHWDSNAPTLQGFRVLLNAGVFDPESDVSGDYDVQETELKFSFFCFFVQLTSS